MGIAAPWTRAGVQRIDVLFQLAATVEKYGVWVMDAKEAINTAKNWINEIHAEEGVRNVGLEEVRRQGDVWKITIGFSRPWDENRNLSVVLGGNPSVSRTYKIVTIRDDNGEVVASENRELSR